jgi:Asp-tRNA(Asn)/Glu-tRNA(Gln) amidotransferase A subunit family amidase
VRTTGGYPPLSNHVPKKDATAVARLKAAGAVLIGKTNVPPLSADGRADNPIFGRTNNPGTSSARPAVPPAAPRRSRRDSRPSTSAATSRLPCACLRTGADSSA